MLMPGLLGLSVHLNKYSKCTFIENSEQIFSEYVLRTLSTTLSQVKAKSKELEASEWTEHLLVSYLGDLSWPTPSPENDKGGIL